MANTMDVQSYLKGVDYPASKEDLVNKAKENNATPDVIDALSELPDNTYDSPADVQSVLAEDEESEDTAPEETV